MQQDNAAIEQDIRAAVAQREIKEAADPSQRPEELIGKRADEVVDQITDKALSELRVLRDAIDDQMRAMIARRDELKRMIREQVGLATQAIEVKNIAEDAVTRLTQSIETGLPAPVARTITAQKRNGATS